MQCKDFYGSGTQTRTADGSPWGDWLATKFCPANSYVCGVNAQLESYQGSGDDSSLNGVEFFCCTSQGLLW